MATKKTIAEKKTAKKRPSKGKNPTLGRFKIYIVIALFVLLLATLVYIAITNDQTKTQAKAQTAQKTEQVTVKNVAQTAKKEQNKVREAIKFDKDENLSKIFIDPKSNDETHALSQKQQPTSQKPSITQKLSDKTILEKPKEANTTNSKETQIKENNKITELSKTTEQNETKNFNPTELDVMFDENIETKRKLATTHDENLTTPKIEQKNKQGLKSQQEQKPQNNKENKSKQQENIAQSKKETPKISEPKPLKQTNSKYTNKGKAKLAIVIDDVATHAHANMIFSTGIKITPSIFPVSRNYPDTKDVAKKFKFFMIHLPMQAQNSNAQEAETLLVNESSQSIAQKVHKIRLDFPKARFINNHTGSKFTSNFDAMNRAFEILQNEGFVFMDSKTIGTSKVAAISQKHGVPYFSRDVFLDDADHYTTIYKQLALAVRIAKQNGVAIAIGHPRKNTIAVLKNAKELLKDVELIYINEAYELIKR